MWKKTGPINMSTNEALLLAPKSYISTIMKVDYLQAPWQRNWHVFLFYVHTILSFEMKTA